MPQLVKKRRSAWAVLAVAAMFASLLAVAASPVGAAEVGSDDASPDIEAPTQACVGDALKDNGFTDVTDGHFFKNHINCIAYYGITQGTGDGTTFSPNDNITRAEVATMIVRAAKAAGADLDDAMGDKFDDIEDVAEVFRDSINVLAENEVIASGGDFRPNDDITRAEMAVMVDALLKATTDKYGPNGQLKKVPNVGDLDHFKDSRATMPADTDHAISRLYELGVALGTDASGVFNPEGLLTRGQMAAFITRALAYTSVRPAGVTAQWNGEDIVVSARDDKFLPEVDVVVDAFQIATENADSAVKSDGTCDEEEVDKTGGLGSGVCEIDDTDDKTGNDGNFEITDLDIESDTTVWVWTGNTGDTFGSDTVVYRLDISTDDSAPVKASRVHISHDLKGEKAKVGSSVVFTVQLQDETEKPASVGLKDNKPASFDVTITRHDRNSANNGFVADVSRRTTSTVTTDVEGKATFTVSAPAVDANDPKGDKYRFTVAIQQRDNAPAALANDATNPYFFGDGNTRLTTSSDGGQMNIPGEIVFSTFDSDKGLGGATVDTRITVKPAALFLEASDEGTGASSSVTATVVDQYGEGVPDIELRLSSGDDDVKITRSVDKTRNDGTRTWRYTRDKDTSSAATFRVAWVWQTNTPAEMTADEKVIVQFATRVTSGAQTANQPILSFDKDTNTIFAGTGGEVKVFTYDNFGRGDRFDLSTDGGSNFSTSSYAEFEKNLDKDAHIRWNIIGTRKRETNTFRLVLGAS